MSDSHQEIEEFWQNLPAEILHPARVQMVEALRWIGRPLTPADFDCVLDGDPARLAVIHHLRLLEKLDVVEPAPIATHKLRAPDLSEMPYRLTDVSER